MILLGRIHLSITPAGLLVVRDLDRKPDLLEEWKADLPAWRVERWAG